MRLIRCRMRRISGRQQRIRFIASVNDMRASRSDSHEHLRAFGKRVRRLRQDAGMSQEQLADAAGLHRTVVGRLERAEREVGVGTLWPLASALGVSVSELLPE